MLVGACSPGGKTPPWLARAPRWLVRCCLPGRTRPCTSPPGSLPASSSTHLSIPAVSPRRATCGSYSSRCRSGSRRTQGRGARGAAAAAPGAGHSKGGRLLGAPRPQPKMTDDEAEPARSEVPGTRSLRPPPPPQPPPPPRRSALRVCAGEDSAPRGSRDTRRRRHRGGGRGGRPPRRPRRPPAARPCPSSRHGSWPGSARPGLALCRIPRAARLLPPLLSLLFSRSRPFPRPLLCEPRLPPASPSNRLAHRGTFIKT